MSNPTPALCGAKNRLGEPCKRYPAKGKRRCRLHGGAPGSGAPFGPRNGRWKDGRYSRLKTPEERQEAWRAYYARKAAQNEATEIPGLLCVEDFGSLPTMADLLGDGTR